MDEYDLEKEENIILMHQFIAKLREIDKSIIMLFLDEYSYSEIGEIIGITEINVATRISRIKEILRKNFSSHQ